MSEVLLQIEDLHVEVEGREILKGLDLSLEKGDIHALMGPNGSGKSTLAYVLTGRPGYDVTQGKVLYKGEDILALAPDERAQRGIFLAFQYPTEVPGVSVVNFLRTAFNLIHPEAPKSAMEFRLYLQEKVDLLEIPSELVDRYVNQGFSGGEKKRNEILQMAVLEPKLAILDETDSGLDIDALKTVAEGVNRQQARRPRSRRPFDHSLPAVAELHQAVARARPDRRPDSALGWPRTRRGTGGRGVRWYREGARARERDHRGRGTGAVLAMRGRERCR